MSGDLRLDCSPIAALSEGLRVGGSLSLAGTKVAALPEWLSVGGDLFLKGAAITAVPEGVRVGGKAEVNISVRRHGGSYRRRMSSIGMWNSV